MIPKPVQLTINDRRVCVSVTDDETLLLTLRDNLGYTEVRGGCEEGACGSCTVILNDRPVPSCLILTTTVDESTIYTWTGIMNDPLAIRLRSVFHKHNAFQCGFCEAGILLHLYAELRLNPKPSPDVVESILNSHICRCGGYGLMRDALAEFIDSHD